jgi:predicted enzyme related to lactoylglutathione lyase
MMLRIYRLPLLLCAPLALALGAACDPSNEDADASVRQPPEPYSEVVVYVADGVYNPADPSVVPPTLEQNQRELWGLSDAEIAQYEVDAFAFYSERFGIDVDDPANADRLSLTRFGCDPRLAYRVVMMAGRVVPPEGWPVCDAGYLLTITDPEGVELGGEFQGQTAPVGASMAFGRYHIETDTDEAITISFRAISPYIADPYGNSAIRCELDSPQLGEGEANLVFRLDQRPSGEFAFSIRNVLNFD